MRLCVRWLYVCAGEEKRTLRKSAFCARTLTEKRTLDGRRHGKAHFACGPHQRAHSALSACERWLRREPIFADLYTLLHTHGRSRDRAGPWVPRHRGPHGPRDARALGPEVHATGAVTQPPTRTHEASFLIPICMMEARANQPDGIPQMVDMSNPTHCGKLFCNARSIGLQLCAP